MKRKLLLLFLLAYVMSVAFNALITKIKLEKVYGGGIIRLPTKYVKYFTAGYDNFIADLIYIWAIQYFSTPEIKNKEENLLTFFKVIWELDPHYTSTYDTAALIANYDFGNPRLAIQILLEGYKRNPDNWYLLGEAGFYAFRHLKDYALAYKLFKKAYEINPEKRVLKRMAAAMLERKGSLEVAWEYWREIYNTAKTEGERIAAKRHLYKIKARLDISFLQRAIQKFKKKFGRNPASLEELVKKGIVKKIPKDLNGEEYLYDPSTGEVRAKKRYVWK